MKWRDPPFSAGRGPQAIGWGARPAREPANRVMRIPAGGTIAVSPSSRKTTSRVWGRRAGMSEATNCSPSPRPSTSGGPMRAATSVWGSSRGVSTRAETPPLSAPALAQPPPQRLFSRPSVVGLDEVSHDLGVGLRGEAVAVGEEARLQREVVLDDPVVDDDQAARVVEVRVGILLPGPPVRCPTGVPHPPLPGEGLQAEALLELRDLARRPPPAESPAVDDSEAGGVVTAVLEAAQTLEE